MMASNIFNFHTYLGNIPILTNIFQMGWNHKLAFFELFHIQTVQEFQGLVYQ